MGNEVTYFEVVKDPFSMETIEDGADLEAIGYFATGERRYGVGRQLHNRGCDDALVGFGEGDSRGIPLVERDAEPARGYLWCLGGNTKRGVRKKRSLSERVQKESGLIIDPNSLVKLGDVRAIWATTNYRSVEAHPKIKELVLSEDAKSMTVRQIMDYAGSLGVGELISNMSMQSLADLVQERDLPSGIDDFGNIFYADASGSLKLDFLHKNQVIVTPKNYTDKFRDGLHEYIREAMDRAIPLLMQSR